MCCACGGGEVAAAAAAEGRVERVWAVPLNATAGGGGRGFVGRPPTLELRAARHFAGLASFTVVAIATEALNGDRAEHAVNATALFTAVADAPELAVRGPRHVSTRAPPSPLAVRGGR